MCSRLGAQVPRPFASSSVATRLPRKAQYCHCHCRCLYDITDISVGTASAAVFNHHRWASAILRIHDTPRSTLVRKSSTARQLYPIQAPYASRCRATTAYLDTDCLCSIPIRSDGNSPLTVHPPLLVATFGGWPSYILFATSGQPQSCLPPAP